MLLVYLSCAWVAGIWLGTSINLPLTLGLLAVLPLLRLFFTRNYRKPVIITSLGIVIFVVAAAYSFNSLNTVDAARLRFYNDTGPVEIKGMVAGAPDERDRNTRLTLSVTEVRLNGEWRGVSGRALVFVPRYPAYRYGDVLLINGELETPPVLDDFDYRGYLAHQGISTTILYPRIEVLDGGQGFPPLAWIYSLRSRLAESLAGVLPEPPAALGQGIILGIRGNIPLELRSDFAASGTAHLLAISGLHLGVMAGVLLGVGLWLFGRRHYLYVWLALAAIWLYALITGMHPPVVRGAIMASLFLLAELLGRQRSAMVALTLAAAVMVGVHPFILGDASFQLSFLAMAGLVFIFPVIRDLGRRAVAAMLGEEGALATTASVIIDTWSATLGAVIAVWPVVAHYFGIVSLVGPLATFLALPALPGVIVFGGLAAVMGLVSLAVAQLIGWLAWLFLSYMLLVVGGLASPAVSSIEADAINPAFVWGYYIILAGIIWFNGYRKRLHAVISGTSVRMREGVGLSFSFSRLGRWLVVPLLVVAVLLTYTAATMPDDKLRVSFLDVGEGDAVLIHKGSWQVLVDGGPSPQAIALGLGRRMPFWDREIDLLVLTHPHHDHLAGLVEVLRRYQVGQVLYFAPDDESPLYEEWQRLIAEKEIENIPARAGQLIDFGGDAVIRVLNPRPELISGSESDEDNNAVVLHLTAGDISFLLTSDIRWEAEQELVRNRAALASTVLKVAHHGSATSTTHGFLAVVNPQVAVISVGADNRYGHPDNEVVKRLEERVGQNIYRTDEQGTIDFITDGKRLWVEVGK